MTNTNIPWAQWPEEQKGRVRKEITVLLGLRCIEERPQVIHAVLYELYPYAIKDPAYDTLVRDIFADVRSISPSCEHLKENTMPASNEKQHTDEELLRQARRVLRLCVGVNPYGTADNAALARDARAKAHNLLDALDRRLGLTGARYVD